MFLVQIGNHITIIGFLFIGKDAHIWMKGHGWVTPSLSAHCWALRNKKVVTDTAGETSGRSRLPLQFKDRIGTHYVSVYFSFDIMIQCFCNMTLKPFCVFKTTWERPAQQSVLLTSPAHRPQRNWQTSGDQLRCLIPIHIRDEIAKRQRWVEGLIHSPHAAFAPLRGWRRAGLQSKRPSQQQLRVKPRIFPSENYQTVFTVSILQLTLQTLHAF